MLSIPTSRFVQVSRERGINIVVKDFYKEASDFAKGTCLEATCTAHGHWCSLSDSHMRAAIVYCLLLLLPFAGS